MTFINVESMIVSMNNHQPWIASCCYKWIFKYLISKNKLLCREIDDNGHIDCREHGSVEYWFGCNQGIGINEKY